MLPFEANSANFATYTVWLFTRGQNDAQKLIAVETTTDQDDALHLSTALFSKEHKVRGWEM